MASQAGRRRGASSRWARPRRPRSCWPTSGPRRARERRRGALAGQGRGGRWAEHQGRRASTSRSAIALEPKAVRRVHGARPALYGRANAPARRWASSSRRRQNVDITAEVRRSAGLGGARAQPRRRRDRAVHAGARDGAPGFVRLSSGSPLRTGANGMLDEADGRASEKVDALGCEVPGSARSSRAGSRRRRGDMDGAAVSYRVRRSSSRLNDAALKSRLGAVLVLDGPATRRPRTLLRGGVGGAAVLGRGRALLWGASSSSGARRRPRASDFLRAARLEPESGLYRPVRRLGGAGVERDERPRCGSWTPR